jgi:hypothetical protein
MPSKQRAAGRKAAKRSIEIARQKRMFKLQRKRQPLIPTSLLKALAASGLPADPVAYNARLRELLEA